MDWLKERLFSNVGEKIKTLTVVLFILEALSCIVGGIIVLVTPGSSMSNSSQTVIIGLLLIILGPILCWVEALLLYGFGELVDNSNIKQWPRAKNLGDWYCSVCGTFNTEKNKSCVFCHTIKK